MKKLRYKFILVTMLSLVAVLVFLLGTVGLVNYSSGTKNADELLTVLSLNDGSFNNPNEEMGERNQQFDNKETPYETRFFTVTYFSSETKVNLSFIASIDEKTAISMADSVKNKKENGYVGVYRYLVNNKDNFTQVIFLDNTRNLESVKNFLITGAWVSSIGVVLVFILVFFLSNKVFQPVQKSYDKQKRFITNASHELKTPLTIISANSELLEIEYGQNESTMAINKQVGRMSTMVKNMVLLSKLDENNKLENISQVNLSSLASEITGDYEMVFKANNKEFKSEIEKDLTIKGDESLLSQMISLLLDNANKYAVSKITFDIKQNGKYIELLTTNDTDSKEKDGNVLLERFYRSDEARKNYEGSGIGLSIVNEIVIHHHGSININILNSIFECKIKFKM